MRLCNLYPTSIKDITRICIDKYELEPFEIIRNKEDTVIISINGHPTFIEEFPGQCSTVVMYNLPSPYDFVNVLKVVEEICRYCSYSFILISDVFYNSTTWVEKYKTYYENGFVDVYEGNNRRTSNHIKVLIKPVEE